MKRILIVLLLIPIFAHSQAAQSDRWSFVFEDKTANTKSYIDTQTIEYVDCFEGHQNVYTVWLKTFSDFSSGTYHTENITHMLIDMNTKQCGFKSVVTRKDGVVGVNKTFILVEWHDFVPETNAEMLLNYCKSLHK